MSRSLALSLAALAVLACAPAVAAPPVRMEIVDRDSGRWLDQYPRRDDTWIAGTPGHRYAVRLTNTSQVASADIDAIEGFYTRSAVPEPATWAMLILGFGAVGASLRTRTRRAAQARLAWN